MVLYTNILCRQTLWLRLTSLLSLLLLGADCFCQCSPPTGPPPSNLEFNTGSNGQGGSLQPGSFDLHWTVATDSINSNYGPAVVMDSLPPDFYKSPWPDCNWISISRSGIHAQNHHFFFKKEFSLPCTSPCGKSYNNDNSFCLSLDVFADNSVYEIYINGVPQSGYLLNRIPVQPDPLHAVGMKQGGMISFSLCHNWKAGANTLIIEVATSAPVTGFLAQASTVYRQSLSNVVEASICQGRSYVFGNQTLTEPGIVYQTFQTSAGCDSTVALSLQVQPVAFTTIDQTICKGESFSGHTVSGHYIDTFTNANGCDSMRTLNLLVREVHLPQLPARSLLCKGDTLVLSPGTYLSYLWQDSSSGARYIVREPGVYTVRLTDACGTAEVSTVVVEGACGVYFPSAFTPNSDGLNDHFKVLSNEPLGEYQLLVYNRWGQKVFESRTQSVGWDGRLRGKQQGTDIFAWICSFNKHGLISHIKGLVTLIR